MKFELRKFVVVTNIVDGYNAHCQAFNESQAERIFKAQGKMQGNRTVMSYDNYLAALSGKRPAQPKSEQQDKATPRPSIPCCKRCKVTLHGDYDKASGNIIPSTKEFCPSCAERNALLAVAEAAKLVASSGNLHNGLRDENTLAIVDEALAAYDAVK